MTLRLRDKGIATAYATVSVGDVEREMKTAADAVIELRTKIVNEAVLEGRTARELPSEPQSIFLLGQADVATVIETSNFKHIFDLHYPRAVDSPAGVVNWVFSVPYELPDAERPAGAACRFILQLRFRRAAYAYHDFERTIVMKLCELLGDNRKGARVHVGLGWSDLIVDGWFTPDTFEKLTQFILKVHGLKLVTGPEKKHTIPVLQRMLTLIGYVGKAPKFEGNTHVTFLRTRAGYHDEAVKLLHRTDAQGRRIFCDDMYALDGKADYMLQSFRADENWLERQRELGDGTHRDILRKVETHLMFIPADHFKNEGAGLEINVAQRPAHKEECGCTSIATEPVRMIRERMQSLEVFQLLPTEHRYALDNMLFLLAAPLRDSSICCDAKDAILTCFEGLQLILNEIDALAPAGEEDEAKYAALVNLWRQLDEWHRFSDMLLRQRTVGSYEEILGQSDRSVVYSGGVQKFLFLSDQLANDFARRLVPKDTPRFATIFDSVKTIISFRTGLMRVPTSEIFSFALIVPDLWHEVGGYLYFLRGAERMISASPTGQKNETLNDLADHYADLIVYLHGFRGEFAKFVASRIHLWERTYGKAPKRLTPFVNAQQKRDQLLARLYLVFEFHKIRRARIDRDDEVILGFVNEPLETIDSFVKQLRQQLGAYPSLGITEDDWMKLKANVKSQDFSNFQRKLYNDEEIMKATVSGGSVDLTPFRAGKVVAFTAEHDLNAYFGELAFEMLEAMRDEKTVLPHFQMLASLGKSAAIEFHRRSITLETP